MSEEIKALEERIAKAKAARAALEAAAEQRAEIARLERLARLEEQATIDAPHIEAARQTHGEDRTAVIDSDLGAIVVKKPNHLKWNALMAKGEKVEHADMIGLLRSCLVYPDWPRVDKMLEEAPAAIIVIGDALAQLAVNSAKARSGK